MWSSSSSWTMDVEVVLHRSLHHILFLKAIVFALEETSIVTPLLTCRDCEFCYLQIDNPEDVLL